MGGLFSIYEGVHKLHSPEPLKDAWMALSILAFGIVAESVSLWGACARSTRSAADASYCGLVPHSRTERAGGDLRRRPGGARRPGAGVRLHRHRAGHAATRCGMPLGSIAIGALLVLVAVLVGKEVAAMLLGQSADPAVRAALREHLAQQPEVQQCTQPASRSSSARRDGRGQGADEAARRRARADRRGEPRRAVAARAFPQVRWCFFEADHGD